MKQCDRCLNNIIHVNWLTDTKSGTDHFICDECLAPFQEMFFKLREELFEEWKKSFKKRS